VRQDATVSYQGKRFEVPYELARQHVQLVVDPHTEQVIGVQNDNGQSLGAATPLDAVANAHRARRQPTPVACEPHAPTGLNAVEQAYRAYHALPKPTDEEEN
jgi:putative transposase